MPQDHSTVLWKKLSLVFNLCLGYFDNKSFLAKVYLLDNVNLDMSTMSCNLLKKAFAAWQHALISTRITLYDIFAQVCSEIKILIKWPTSKALFNFFQFCLSSFSFSIFLLQWLTFYWACFQFKNSLDSTIKTDFSNQEVAKCSWGKFSCKFFTQCFGHYLCIFQAQLIQSIWSG